MVQVREAAAERRCASPAALSDMHAPCPFGYCRLSPALCASVLPLLYSTPQAAPGLGRLCRGQRPAEEGLVHAHI